MSCAHVATLLTLEVHKHPPELLLRLSGDLDVLSAGFLQLPRPAAFDGVNRLLVDLSGLTFCDLAGLRRLAHLDADYAAAGFDVRLVGARPLVRRAAMLTGLAPGLYHGGEPPVAPAIAAGPAGPSSSGSVDRPRRNRLPTQSWTHDHPPEHPAAS